MRRRKGFTWLVVVAVSLTGCQRPFFMNEASYKEYNRMSGDYGAGRYDDEPVTAPVIPRTVREPAAKVRWEASLEEVKRIALANSKQIALVGYQPGIQETNVDTELALFDAVFGIGGAWGHSDRQVANLVQTFGTNQNTVNQNTFGGSLGFGRNLTSGGSIDGATGTGTGNDMISISKRNAVGGITTLGYSIDYSRVRPTSSFTALNPSWTQQVSLGIEQPLLQGAGVEVNRARLLIARAQHGQAIRSFDEQVQTLLRDVELAYWQLYFTYIDLYSRDVGMKQALATWQKEKNKEEVGTSAIPDVAQAREQYEFFRANRVQAMDRLLKAERQLRQLMGIAPEDGRELIPKDDPSETEYEPNWEAAVLEAMENRPDLGQQRFVIRAAEVELFRQKNGLLPDLSVTASYVISGLDNQFDQSLDRLTDNRFTDWSFGFRYARQIGERGAHAGVRKAQLTLSQERARLRNLEHTVVHGLHEAYQDLITNFDLIQIQMERREAAAQQLIARMQFYLQGKASLDLVLEAQVRFTDALRDEGQAKIQYNQALARWEFARGTMLANDNVVLAEERLSWASPKFREKRERQWRNSLPLPIHPDGAPAIDEAYPPDYFGPLYPALTPEETPAAAAPVPAAPKSSTENAPNAGKPANAPATEKLNMKYLEKLKNLPPIDEKTNAAQLP